MTNSSTIPILESLIGFRSISALSNRPMIDYLVEKIKPCARAIHIVESADGKKAGLIAAFGPDKPGGLLLSGHTDVVPVEGQQWESDPFKLRRAEGMLYGRGTADMKGFIASCLGQLSVLGDLDLKLPVYFAFSYDEEIGCLGTYPLLERMRKEGYSPTFVVVGEPTNMKIADGHKGIYHLKTRIRGREGHSSDPDKGANAILAAAELIGYMQRLQKTAKDSPHRSFHFSPPHTTISVGVIEGGTIDNIIPRDCWFSWQIRPIKDSEAVEIIKRLNSYAQEAILPRLRATAPEAKIETIIEVEVPGMEPVQESKICQIMAEITGEDKRIGLGYASEAGYFQKAGLDVVVCGPGLIEQAHRANEYVSETQLARCDQVLQQLFNWMAR